MVAVADNGIAKIGKIIPGCLIQVKPPMELFVDCNYPVVIFPWNIAEELVQDLRTNYLGFTGEIWTAVPEMTKKYAS
jgi:hypothetical protein